MKKFIIIIICLLIFIKLSRRRQLFQNNKPCSSDISDIQYMEHMIPHHQVAVDISKMLQKKTKWPKMQEILRKLIWVQEYEIELMNQILKENMSNVSLNKINTNYISMVSDFIKPNKLGLTNTYCDPNFFDPEAHMKHMEHMVLDDNMYIEHMVPHHQVAVDMSKNLLKTTKNDFMIYLCYRIIRSQQEEIILLNDLIKSKNRYLSNIII